MSRVTRSASASIVSIIRRFWSSVKRSQRRSRVEENPLTEVSGERSSWATVEMRAAWLASARRRCSASRSTTTTRFTGWLRPGRRYLAVTRASRPLASISSFSRCPVRVRRPAPRVGGLPPRAAVAVLQADHLTDVAPADVVGLEPGDALEAPVEVDDAGLRVGSDEAVGNHLRGARGCLGAQTAPRRRRTWRHPSDCWGCGPRQTRRDRRWRPSRGSATRPVRRWARARPRRSACADLGLQPPGLVAHHPRVRALQGDLRQQPLPRAVGREEPDPVAAQGGEGLPDRQPRDDRQVEDRAGGGADDLGRVDVDGVSLTSTASAPAASAPRMTVPALPGSRTFVSRTSSRGGRGQHVRRARPGPPGIRPRGPGAPRCRTSRRGPPR